MAQRIVTNERLAAALIKRGLVPDRCRLIDVQIGVTGGVVIRYEKYVDTKELTTFADALIEVAVELNTDNDTR